MNKFDVGMIGFIIGFTSCMAMLLIAEVIIL